MTPEDPNPADTDRLTLLDRLAERVPELDLDRHAVEWTELPDGAQALLVDGSGFDGGSGMFFANAGVDVHGGIARTAGPGRRLRREWAGRQPRTRPR
jgi:hypothetical protein